MAQFQAGVDVDDSGFTAYYEPTREAMFNCLHESIRGAFTEFAGAADRLGGEEGNPGWAPFRVMGDQHMRFHYPECEVIAWIFL